MTEVDPRVLKAERQSLGVHQVAMTVFAVTGFITYAISGVSATQLDGVISLINAGAALIAVRLAVAAVQPPTQQASRWSSSRCFRRARPSRRTASTSRPSRTV